MTVRIPGSVLSAVLAVATSIAHGAPSGSGDCEVPPSSHVQEALFLDPDRVVIAAAAQEGNGTRLVLANVQGSTLTAVKCTKPRSGMSTALGRAGEALAWALWDEDEVAGELLKVEGFGGAEDSKGQSPPTVKLQCKIEEGVVRGVFVDNAGTWRAKGAKVRDGVWSPMTDKDCKTHVYNVPGYAELAGRRSVHYSLDKRGSWQTEVYMRKSTPKLESFRAMTIAFSRSQKDDPVVWLAGWSRPEQRPSHLALYRCASEVCKDMDLAQRGSVSGRTEIAIMETGAGAGGPRTEVAITLVGEAGAQTWWFGPEGPVGGPLATMSGRIPLAAAGGRVLVEDVGVDKPPQVVQVTMVPDMVRIEPGCFQMGSPSSEKGRFDDERQHRVCIDRAFGMGRHEVTFAEYDRFARATGRGLPSDEGWGRGKRPVINVSWHDAAVYAEWLSGETGKRYRLPTEAEWEYAARAGTTTARHWGNDPDAACPYANVADDSAKRQYSGLTIHGCDDGHVHTAPVGSFQANDWGLHDMLSNVWEWTCSAYESGYDGSENSCASHSERGLRAIRGGSWFSIPARVRSANRSWVPPTLRSYLLGFRLAQDL